MCWYFYKTAVFLHIFSFTPQIALPCFWLATNLIPFYDCTLSIPLVCLWNIFSCFSGRLMMTPPLKRKSHCCLKVSTRSSGRLLKMCRRRKCVLGWDVCQCWSLFSMIKCVCLKLKMIPCFHVCRIMQLRWTFCRRNRQHWRKKCLNWSKNWKPR